MIITIYTILYLSLTSLSGDYSDTMNVFIGLYLITLTVLIARDWWFSRVVQHMFDDRILPPIVVAETVKRWWGRIWIVYGLEVCAFGAVGLLDPTLWAIAGVLWTLVCFVKRGIVVDTRARLLAEAALRRKIEGGWK